VDGKSGISGAGRTPKDRSHAAAVLDNVTPYAVGAHKHAPEIAQLLGFPVTFVPHVVPLRRGLVCTCYVSAREDPRARLEAAYADSHVVEVVDAVPDVARVQGTDTAEVAAFQTARPAAGSSSARSTTLEKALPGRRSRTPTWCSASRRPRA
jgi:N-acetyl-gamma-glutamyl-phosphate reductase